MPHPWENSWKIVERLGKGGQGVTHKVESLSDPAQTGVLKYLINNQSPAARARMFREVSTLQALAALGGKVPATLEHNADKFADPKVELYLVMEFIDGLTLSEFVKANGKLSVDKATAFALSLCETIKLAHGNAIIHRDIKPDNIIVNDEAADELFLVDYGLSFNADDSDITVTEETFRNKFLGLPEANTPGGDRRDPRSDVTALCAVFYFMLTGHYPGQLQDGDGKPPHLRPGYSIREAIPEDARRTQVELMLSRGHAPQTQNRFQTIDELSERLETLRAQSAGLYALDPTAVAKDLSAQLRAQDRRTQIAEFQPHADKLLKDFAQRITKKWAKSLGRFRVGTSPGGSDFNVPSGLDAVCNCYSVMLNLDHHGEIARRGYKVASRGEECVVVACDMVASSGRGGIGVHRQITPGEPHELAWYEGEPTDILPALEAEMGEWLVQKMNDGYAQAISDVQGGR